MTTNETPDARRCASTIRGVSRPERRGEPCGNWAMKGQTVCGKHGGKAPQNMKAAALRLADADLDRQASKLVGKPVANPLTELSRLAGRARALVEVLEGRVETLLDADGEDRCPHCDGDLTVDGGSGSGIRYRGGAGEQIRGEIQLYERAMDRLGRVLADIGRLKIDERLAAITAKQAGVIIAALEAGLNAAGVRDPGQRTLAKSAASRELRAVR